MSDGERVFSLTRSSPAMPGLWVASILDDKVKVGRRQDDNGFFYHWLSMGRFYVEWSWRHGR